MKSCIKCGATDRNKRGDCKPCQTKYVAKWRKKRLVQEKICHTKWRKENPEKARAYTAKWKAANPGLNRIYIQNRRAHKKANGGTLSKDLSERLLKRQKGKCVCCKKPLGKKYHLDHIMPLALGGANKDWNMQLLRAGCNSSKGARHPIEYMQEQGFLI